MLSVLQGKTLALSQMERMKGSHLCVRCGNEQDIRDGLSMVMDRQAEQHCYERIYSHYRDNIMIIDFYHVIDGEDVRFEGKCGASTVPIYSRRRGYITEFL